MGGDHSSLEGTPNKDDNLKEDGRMGWFQVELWIVDLTTLLNACVCGG